jgi:hypothetical protein
MAQTESRVVQIIPPPATGGGSGTVTNIATTAPITGGPITTTGTIGVTDFVASGASHARGTVPDPGAVAGTTKFLREDATFAVPPGSTVSPLTTKGDLWGFSTVDARIPVGTDGLQLTADSSVGVGVSWQLAGSFPPIVPGWRTGFFGTIGTRMVSMTGLRGGAVIADGSAAANWVGGGGGGGAPGVLGTNTYYDTWDRCLCGPGTAEVQLRYTALYITRGNSAGVGGFHCAFVFCQDTIATTTKQGFYGLCDTIAALGIGNPSAILNSIYMGYDNGQTTMRIMSNDNAGVATQTVDLGVNFPSTTVRTDPYELHFWATPNDTKVSYWVMNLASRITATGTITTDLPAGTVYMVPHFSMSNSSAQTNNLAVKQFLCETAN